jgi:hypothetical protein
MLLQLHGRETQEEGGPFSAWGEGSAVEALLTESATETTDGASKMDQERDVTRASRRPYQFQRRQPYSRNWTSPEYGYGRAPGTVLDIFVAGRDLTAWMCNARSGEPSTRRGAEHRQSLFGQ